MRKQASRWRPAVLFTDAAKPASTLIGVSALFDPEALLEIEMIAAAPAR